MTERDSSLWFSFVLARLERRHLNRYVQRLYRQHPGILGDGIDLTAPEAEWRDRNRVHKRLEAPSINRLSIRQSRPLSNEEVQFHAQLSHRLFELHWEQAGFWSRIRRFLLGNRSH